MEPPTAVQMLAAGECDFVIHKVMQLVVHVADGVNVYARSDERDDAKHHKRQRIDVIADRDLEVAEFAQRVPIAAKVRRRGVAGAGRMLGRSRLRVEPHVVDVGTIQHDALARRLHRNGTRILVHDIANENATVRRHNRRRAGVVRESIRLLGGVFLGCGNRILRQPITEKRGHAQHAACHNRRDRDVGGIFLRAVAHADAKHLWYGIADADYGKRSERQQPGNQQNCR